MAKSAKARKEKKKDFQKPKLKVGKTKPKANNFTDTSFKAKSINVLQQNLSTTAPNQSAQIQHHLSLLNHRSDAQRRDSLSYITNAFHNSTQPPVAVSTVLPKIQPLILDASGSVRAQLLKLISEMQPADLRPHVETVILYIRAAMTHLSVSIRLSGVEILDLMLDKLGTDIIASGGGWVKTLRVFMTQLRWAGDQDKPATKSDAIAAAAGWKAGSATAGKSVDEIKCLSKALQVLGRFLDVGLVERTDLKAMELQEARQCFPLYQTQSYAIPSRSNPYRHLNLFGAPKDTEDQAYEDAADRQKVFEELFGTVVRQGLENMKKEGGTIGREASNTKQLLDRISEGHGKAEVKENYMLTMKRVAYEWITAERRGG